MLKVLKSSILMTSHVLLSPGRGGFKLLCENKKRNAFSSVCFQGGKKISAKRCTSQQSSLAQDLDSVSSTVYALVLHKRRYEPLIARSESPIFELHSARTCALTPYLAIITAP